MKLIIEIDEDDYTMCQILAKEMCDTRMKLTDNLKYAISNGIPLDKIRAEFQKELDICDDSECDMAWAVAMEFALEVIDKCRNEVSECTIKR